MRDGAPRRAGADPIGVLACAGALPLDIAAAAMAEGRPVHLVAIDGFADPRAADYPHDWVGLGQIGHMLAGFRRAGCREIVIAGGMRRPDLRRLRFDWGFVRHLPTILSLTRGGDDSVLRRIVRFFEGQGFIVRGIGDVAPGLLAGAGALGRHQPPPAAEAAMARAAAALLALAEFDIGQAVVATADRILAIEDVRGTDAMLGDLGPSAAGQGLASGGVLVKLAKVGQETRIDLPTIGPRTVAGAKAARLAGIAVGAGQAIVLERSQLVADADAAGLFVTGLTASGTTAAAVAADQVATPLAVLARRAPTPAERRDVAIGRRLMPVLSRLGAGRAAVVANEHVVAVAAALPASAMIGALQHDSQWGRRTVRSRIGTLVLDIASRGADDASRGADEGADEGGDAAAFTDHLDRAVFAAAQAAGLAGIACLGAPLPEARRDEIIGWANDAKLFLLAEPSPTPQSPRIERVGHD